MPSPVDKYFKQIKKDNPSYTDEQAWATAWSIYCRYKNPGSESCHMPTSEYLKKQASERVLARFIEKQGMEHATPEALKKYLQDHPNADPKNHSVKGKDGEERGDGGGPKQKARGQKIHKRIDEFVKKYPHLDKDDVAGLRGDLDKAVKSGKPAAVDKVLNDLATWERSEKRYEK